MVSFEEAFEAFVEKQRSEATGMRLEMLNKDLTGKLYVFGMESANSGRESDG